MFMNCNVFSLTNLLGKLAEIVSFLTIVIVGRNKMKVRLVGAVILWFKGNDLIIVDPFLFSSGTFLKFFFLVHYLVFRFFLTFPTSYLIPTMSFKVGKMILAIVFRYLGMFNVGGRLPVSSPFARRFSISWP